MMLFQDLQGCSNYNVISSRVKRRSGWRVPECGVTKLVVEIAKRLQLGGGSSICSGGGEGSTDDMNNLKMNDVSGSLAGSPNSASIAKW